MKPKELLTRGHGSWLLLLLFLFNLQLAFAQTFTIKGRVLDEEGKPVAGATVSVQDSDRKVLSDAKGLFTLVADKGSMLRITALGFTTKRVEVTQAEVNVRLEEETNVLDEVVVTAMGIKRETKKLGYAVQEVKGDEVNKVRDANPLNAMAGKVAGLTIGASTEMLGRPEIVLRGSKDLLFVVDGVPINSDTWNISPDDIESYSILKGPNAAALYGSRGINGAIVITTKRGKGSEFSGNNWRVDFNSTNQMENSFIVLPESQSEYGRGTRFMYSYGDKLYDNDQRLPTWGPRFEGQLIQQYDSPWDAEKKKRSATPWVSRGAKNYENFVQTGLLSTNNLSFAKAGDDFDMRVSYSHTYQKGIYPNTKLNADNFSLTSGFDINDKFRVEGNLNLNLQYTPNIPDVSYGPNSYAYLFRVYGSADFDVRDLKDIYRGPQGVKDQMQYAHEYGRVNSPWFMAKEWLRGHDKTDIYGNLNLSYKFNDDLKLLARTQITTWNQLRSEKVPPSTNLNGYVQWYSFGWFGDYREDQRRLFENNTDLTLNYNKDLGNWSISALGGLATRMFNFHSNWTTTRGLVIPKLYSFSNSQSPVLEYNYTANMMVYSGFYSFDIGYKNYFNLNSTGRVDKLSTLPDNNNTFFYPSLSLSTVVNDYIKMPNAIDMLKFRASVAEVKGGLTSPTVKSAITAITGVDLTSPGRGVLGYGQDLQTVYDGPSYANQNAYTVFSYYGGMPAVDFSSTIANQNLKPYNRLSYEFGMDLRMLKGRIGLDATYFRTVNGPQIYALNVAPSTSYSSRNINGITTLNQGLEISLNANPIKKQDFNWDISANWSTFRETLKEIYAGEDVLTMNGHNFVVGERLDAIYGRKLARDGQGNVIHNGGLLYPTPSGIGQNALLGHLNPDFTFGINNNFRYKNVSLGFQFDGRVGGSIFDFAYAQAMNAGTAIETVQGAMGEARRKEWESLRDNGKITPHYIGEGVKIVSGTPIFEGGEIKNLDELKFAPNDVPVALQSYITGSNGLLGSTEYFMIDRSFAKLREVSIGYTLPQKFLRKGFIRSASISLVGRNLLYFAQRKDMDLDSYASGFNSSDRRASGSKGTVGLQSAVPRRYGFNLNLSF